MVRRLTGSENGLVGYWTFEEDQGEVVVDYSGNGNDGMLGGGLGAQWPERGISNVPIILVE